LKKYGENHCLSQLKKRSRFKPGTRDDGGHKKKNLQKKEDARIAGHKKNSSYGFGSTAEEKGRKTHMPIKKIEKKPKRGAQSQVSWKSIDQGREDRVTQREEVTHL